MSESPFHGKFAKIMEDLDEISKDITDNQYKELVENVASLHKLIQTSYLSIFKQLIKYKKIDSLQKRLINVYQSECVCDSCIPSSDSD